MLYLIKFKILINLYLSLSFNLTTSNIKNELLLLFNLNFYK